MASGIANKQQVASTDKVLIEVAQKIAAFGLPGVVLVICMSMYGLTGAAAITTALALLGGPAGMLGGIAALGIMGLITDQLTKYGLEILLINIYEERNKNQSNSEKEKTIQEIEDLPLISEETKNRLKSITKKQFTFMLIGRTGVGKSSTINSLLGQDIAKVGAYEATTFDTEKYELSINGIDFLIIDTPGLCDDEEEAGKDFIYLEKVKEAIQSVDSLWFVTRLDETRVSSDEKRGIRLISQALGENIWQRAVILFTFSNSVDKSKFKEALSRRADLIRNEITKYAGSIANKIPAIPVDNTCEITLDGKTWLPELFTLVIERTSDASSLAFAAGMRNEAGLERRIKLTKQQNERVKQKIDIPLAGIFGFFGAVVGALFGPGGCIIGGLLGSALAFRKELDEKSAEN